MRTIFEIVLGLLLIKSYINCFSYKAAVAALTYRLLGKYNDEISDKELKEITVQAGIRLAKDFLHLGR